VKQEAGLSCRSSGVLNDLHGHRAGDEVLRYVAALVDSEKRSWSTVRSVPERAR